MKSVITSFLLLALAGASVHAAEHTVSVVNFSFSPRNLTIEVGDTVTWQNQGTNHNVVADDNSFRCANGCDGDGEGGDGAPASNDWSFSRTFNSVEEIAYFCEVHGAAGGTGMAGTISVQEAEQEEPPPPNINFGHTGSWFEPAANGQGFSIEVVPGDPDRLVVYWFTFARGEPGGVNRQRWFQAQGPINGNMAELDVIQVTGGVFDDPRDPDVETVGTVTVTFSSCTEGILTYDLDLNGDGEVDTSGEIAIERLSPDVLCEEMAGSG